MDKDVSSTQDDGEVSEKQLARARRRQSLLDRMMGARIKRTEHNASESGTGASALAQSAQSSSELSKGEASHRAPGSALDDTDAPRINHLVQPLSVPHAPLATEIKNATGEAIRRIGAAEPEWEASAAIDSQKSAAPAREDGETPTEHQAPINHDALIHPTDVIAEGTGATSGGDVAQAGSPTDTEADPVIKRPGPDAPAAPSSERGASGGAGVSDQSLEPAEHRSAQAAHAAADASADGSADARAMVLDAAETRQTLTTLQNQIYRLKATISTVEKRFLNAKKVHKDQYGQIRVQLDQLVEQVIAAQRASTRAQADAERAAADATALDGRQRAEAEALRAAQEQALANVQAQVTQWSDTIEKSLAALQATEQRGAAQCDAMSEALSGALSDVAARGEAQTNALSALEQQMTSLHEQLSAAVAEAHAAAQQSVAEATEHSSAVAAETRAAAAQMQTEIQGQWQDHLTQWADQVAQWTKTLSAHEHNLQDQKAALSEHQAQYQRLCEHLAAEKNSSEALQQQLEAAVDAATTQKNAVLADYEALKSDYQGEQDALTEEIDRLKQWREEGQKMSMVANAARKAAIKYNGLTEERLNEINKIAADVLAVHEKTATQEAALAAHRDFVTQQSDEQKALAAKIAEESAGLARLGDAFAQTEKDIQQLQSATQMEADRVTAVHAQVAEQAEAVAAHVSRMNAAVAQHAALDEAVNKAVQRVESALAAQQKGFEKIEQLEQQFDVAVESVANLQDEWEARDQEWQQRCSANDANYRNLVALLDRSRQNESALEGLLASVKALEQRSEALVETAQTQCERQADMQMELTEEQSRWDALIARADQSASEAQTAADQAQSALQRVTTAETDAQKRQREHAQANEAVVTKVDRAQAWIKEAVAKTHAWQKEAEAVVSRQTELAAHCEQLVAQSAAQGNVVEQLSETTEALSNSAQARLAQMEAMAARVDAALETVTSTVTEASEQRDALASWAKTTQKQIADMLADNRALANQSRALQHRVSDQSDQAEAAQAAVDAALSTLQTQQAQTDEALAEIERLGDQWSAHQSTLARVESQSHEALQAAQNLQTGAQQLMNSAAADQQQIQTALSTVKNLSDAVAQASDAEQSLRAQVESLMEQVQMQLNTQEQVASDQAEATLRTEVMHDQITALDQATQTRLTQLEDLHKQVAALLTENMSLQSDLKEAQQQVGDLSEQAAQQMDGAQALNQKTEAHLATASDKLAQIDELVPKLTDDMARFSSLGGDYAQWEARLKSQSMTLKESEQKLKDLTKQLDQGLEDVVSIRSEMAAFKTEFGGLKKVLAQVLQKFKGLEESTASLSAQGSNIEAAQAEDQARLSALEAQVSALAQQPAPVVPESPKADAALKKIEKQAQFNEKVLSQFEHLSQGYHHLQSQLAGVLPAPAVLADLTQRVEALEAQLTQLVPDVSGIGSGIGEQQASMAALTDMAADQQAQLVALNDAVQAIQSELLAYASFAEASKTALQRGLHAEDPMASSEAESAVAPDDLVTEEPLDPSPEQAAQAGVDEAITDDAGTPIADSEADNTSPAAAGAEAAVEGEESELDIISQQLEKLSMESQSWDAQFKAETPPKKGGKNMLFSVAVGTSLLVGLQFLQPTAEEQTVPTFAHSSFAVQLNHPAHWMAGPERTLAPDAPVIGHQKHYTYDYAGASLALQWPLPDQVAGEQVTYGLANSALYVAGSLHAPVVAIAPGEVVFSGVNAGQMGNTVIVQHQDELLSVYGHLGATFVDSGAQVSRGQVIARLGKSQWLEPRLYFEIRYEGQSEDPYLYFAS